jgi:hypothetical protein
LADAPPTSFPPPGAKPIWGSHTGTSTPSSAEIPAPSVARRSLSLPSPQGFGNEWPQTFAGDPVDPLSRRLLRLAGGLSLLLVLVVANSFLGSEENPLNPMAVAAERTRSEPGARFAMKAVYTSAALPQPMTARGSGAYNAETGLSEMLLKMSVPPEGPVAMEMIGDDTDLYMRVDGIGDELPGGKEWLKVQPFGGHSQEEMAIGGDADDSLQILGAVSDGVRQMDREKVRGVPTRRYRAAVEMDEVVELYRAEGKDEMADAIEEAAALMTAPVTLEASIDAQDIVRRVRMVMEIPTAPGEPALTMDMRMDLFGFGARPEIALPDPSQVLDATELSEGQLGSIES